MSIEHQEIYLRIMFSFCCLFGFWCIALLFPYRKAKEFKSPKRILTNLALSFGNGLVIKAVVPVSLVYMARYIDSPFPPVPKFYYHGFNVLLGITILDFALYWQHRLSHKFNLLWRLHRVHHSDTEIDTTTAARFHTIEIFLSLFYKGFFVIVFDIPYDAVIYFMILLNSSAQFNHSNFKLPSSVEKFSRLFIITPDLHRIHHSVKHEEMNKNFGFSTSFWDRIFGTYEPNPKESMDKMNIGLNQFRNEQDQNLWALLVQPFRKS